MKRRSGNVPVASLAVFHIGNGLVDIFERTLGDPGLDTLLGGEVEHLADDSGTSNSGSTEMNVV